MQKCNLWPEIFHVKTKICPIHYFRSIYATIKKYVPNDLVKLTVTSVVFGFHIIAIVFVCWPRQFWHFHPVATEQFNFNCCQNTKFVPVHYFGGILPTGKNDTLNESAVQTTTSDCIDLQILSIVFVWWLRQFWHFQPVGTGPWNFNHCQNKNLSGPLFWLYSLYRKEWYTKWISSSNYNII